MRQILQTIFRQSAANESAKSIPQISSKTFDNAKLDEDIRFANPKSDPVNKLIAWRGSIFAHSSLSIVTKQKEYPADLRLFIFDIETLLSRGVEIINRYADVIYSKEFGTDLVGGDAYSFVLECNRKGLQTLDAVRAEWLKNHGVNPEVFSGESGFGRN